MGVNKVEFGDDILIDLTSDTVTEDTLLSGITAHSADGEQIIGNVVISGGKLKKLTEGSGALGGNIASLCPNFNKLTSENFLVKIKELPSASGQRNITSTGTLRVNLDGFTTPDVVYDPTTGDWSLAQISATARGTLVYGASASGICSVEVYLYTDEKIEDSVRSGHLTLSTNGSIHKIDLGYRPKYISITSSGTTSSGTSATKVSTYNADRSTTSFFEDASGRNLPAARGAVLKEVLDDGFTITGDSAGSKRIDCYWFAF